MSFRQRMSPTSGSNLHDTFPEALYKSTKRCAAADSLSAEMRGLWNGLIIRMSGSSCRIFPGSVSVALIIETPDRTILSGNALNNGRSMLIPFCSSTMTVCPCVTAGLITSAIVGGWSGIFFVVTTMKSNGVLSCPEIVRATALILVIDQDKSCKLSQG